MTWKAKAARSLRPGPDEAPERARIFDRSGPFVTVRLNTDATLDNATHRAQQRWREVRDALELEVPQPMR